MAAEEAAGGLSAEAVQSWRDRIHAAALDDAALLQLARDAPTIDLKLAALEALTQEESFKQAMLEFRERDKRLYRLTKSRWETARAEREAVAEAGTLIASARALLDQELVPANRVVELDHAWAELRGANLAAELQAEITQLFEQLRVRVRARGEGEQALSRWMSAVDEAIASLNSSLADVAHGRMPPAESEAPAARLLELLGSDRDTGDPRSVEKTDAAERALALASSIVERAKFLEALPAEGAASEEDEKSSIRQWRAFPEVSEGELHTILAYRFADWRNASTRERQLAHDERSRHERERSAEQTRRHEGAVERDVVAAEAAHAGGQVADLTRLLATIDRALKRAPVNASLRLRIDTLRREELRLRDWQRWSGGQHREELVAEAQELARAATGKVSVKEHGDAITKLRERWKQLDKSGGASRQATWLAFDGALKSAYAPVAAQQEKLRVARDDNLAARNRIVEGLAQAAAKFFPASQTPDASVPAAPSAGNDWRAVAQALEQARTAWQKLGPVEHTVPRKAQQGENAVTTRYAAAVQALEAPLKASYGEARRQREQLVTAAKELGGSDVERRDVVDRVKRLQAQWQTVARTMPLPRRDENALWVAFKAATDAIFAARDAGRAARETELNARSAAREAIIERLAALQSVNAAADIRRALSEADAAWRGAPEVAKPQAGRLDSRYRAARDAATRRIGELAANAAQARYDALLAAMELCREREVAQESGGAGPGEPAPDLEARWQALDQLPEAWKTRLEARFRGNEKPGRAPGASLPDILLKLEDACGIDSPAEFSAARHGLKLLALKAAMEDRRAVVISPADIERWMLDAAAAPLPDEVSRERLVKIIAAVRRRRPG